MFSKTQRLSRSEFDHYFKVGKRHHFSHHTIIQAPLPTLRVAVVVGKKVSKHAVRRNTLKRRIYARLRNELVQNNTTGVFIVITKPTYNSLTRTAADEYLTTSIAQVRKTP